jgi:Ni/Co efflux regulator RcnB
MKRIQQALALAVIATFLLAGTAFSQDHRDDQADHHDNQADHHDNHHDNHAYVRHDEWRKGETIRHEDWDRGERIDYRRYHLHAPPHGYEWREVDGNYVLAAVATGVIASVIAASAAH